MVNYECCLNDNSVSESSGVISRKIYKIVK